MIIIKTFEEIKEGRNQQYLCGVPNLRGQEEERCIHQ